MALDAKALTMLGEMRSDLKWLIASATQSHSAQLDLHDRVTKLEARVPEAPATKAWLNIAQLALGLLPLLAALAGQIPWAKAFELAQRSTGG